jgi:hypothetical protein
MVGPEAARLAIDAWTISAGIVAAHHGPDGQGRKVTESWLPMMGRRCRSGGGNF